MAASVAVSYDDLSASSGASDFSNDDGDCSSGLHGVDDESRHSLNSGGDEDSLDGKPDGSGRSKKASATTMKTAESEHAAEKRSGLAAVMASILAKQLPDAAEPILAKAKTEREILAAKRKLSSTAGQQQNTLDVVPADGGPVGEEEEEAEESAEEASSSAAATTADEPPVKSQRKRLSKVQKKRKADNLCRVKPKVTEKTFEKTLQKIAARGVVQLFNAVRQQQKQTDEKLQAVGSSEVKRQQVLRSFTKGSFLDMLKANGSTATTVIRSNGCNTSSASKDRVSLADSGMATVSFATSCRPQSAVQQPSWKVLHDDFMMGGNMKDWDKASEDAGD